MFLREGHSLITLKLIRIPQEARLKEYRSWHTLILISKPPLNHCYKTPHQIPHLSHAAGLGHVVLQGTSPLCPPFAWQSNKAILFYFTQNSVLEI